MIKGSPGSSLTTPEVDGAGGWIKVYRSMLDHGHLRMPENALKVWLYLLLQVNYKPGGNCAAGEGWVTYRMMREGCCEPDGPQWSDHTINNALGYLESNGYIRRVKTKSGAPQRIRIINWHKYQGQSPAVTTAPTAEVTAGLTAEVTADKQEGKEGKQRIPPTPQQGEKVTSRKSKAGGEEYSISFEAWWAVYRRKDDKRGAFDKWKASLRQGATEEQLLMAARNYMAKRAAEEPKYDMHATTFLGPRKRWQEFLLDNQVMLQPVVIPSMPADDATRQLRELRRMKSGEPQPEAV